MKKKMIAILLTAALGSAWTASALAEETAETETLGDGAELIEIPDIVFTEEDAPYEGDWITFDAGFKLYLPTDWVEQDISDEDAADGLVYWVTAPDDTGWALTLVYLPADEDSADTTLPELAEAFSAETDTYANVGQAVVNDIDVLTYDSADGTAKGELFMDEEGGVYIVTCGPMDDESFQETAGALMDSLSPVTDETETETEAETTETAEAAGADT